MEEKIPIFLPNPWNDILDGSVVVVTGASKSGTTVAALLLASMKPTYHIYEPALLKTIPPFELDPGLIGVISTTFLYDYCLPIARGVRICDYEFQAVNSEWQWATQQSERSRRRGDIQFDGTRIFVYLLRERPLWVVNVLDGLPRLKLWEQIFPGMHTIHVVRNGFDVLASSVSRREWYTNDYFSYPMHFAIDWVVLGNGYAVPWWLGEEARFLWPEWTTMTRAAHMWLVQVEMHPPTIRFEELTTNPTNVARTIVRKFMFLEDTDLTPKWIQRLTMKDIPPHGLTLSDIQEPERNKFKEAMEKLEYL